MVDKRLGGLSLTDDGDEGLSFQVDAEAATKNDTQLCLVEYFLTDRPI